MAIKKILLIFTMLLYSCISNALSVDTMKYKPMLKNILGELYKNFYEFKPEDSPIEIVTEITVIQNPSVYSKVKDDTSFNLLSNFSQHDYAEIHDQRNGWVYSSSSMLIMIDKKDKSIRIDEPKTIENLNQESNRMKLRASSLIDSLFLGSVTKEGDIISLERSFSPANDDIEEYYKHIKLQVDIKKMQVLLQDVEYGNSTVSHLLCRYYYKMKEARRSALSIEEIKKNPEFKEFKIIDKRIKK